MFREEPLPDNHPFWKHPQIILTPHTSARTLAADSIAQIVGKVAAMSRGEAVTGRVDLKRILNPLSRCACPLSLPGRGDDTNAAGRPLLGVSRKGCACSIVSVKKR